MPQCAVSRSVLLDIATRSSLDPSLASVCAMRPEALTVAAYQVLYVVSVAIQLKACHNASNAQARPADVLSVGVRRPRGAIVAAPSQLAVAIIGGGTVGSRIASLLLESEMMHPSALSIVTRQPAQLPHFASRGVRCFPQEEIETVRVADVVVLACQPGQVAAVAKRVGGKLKPSALVISVCCGVSVEKVCNELEHDLCLTTAVDVGSIASAVSRMLEDDDAMERDERSAQWASDDGQSPMPSSGPSAPRRNAAQRRRQTLDLAFPCDAVVLEEGERGDAPGDGRDFEEGAVSAGGGGGWRVPSYVFLDRFLWCLVGMRNRWMRGGMAGGHQQQIEGLVMVWALLVNSTLRQQLVALLASPEAFRSLLLASMERTNGDGGAAQQHQSPPRQQTAASASSDGPSTESPLLDRTTVAWFARHVVQCAPTALIDNMRDQFAQLLL